MIPRLFNAKVLVILDCHGKQIQQMSGFFFWTCLSRSLYDQHHPRLLVLHFAGGIKVFVHGHRQPVPRHNYNIAYEILLGYSFLHELIVPLLFVTPAREWIPVLNSGGIRSWLSVQEPRVDWGRLRKSAYLLPLEERHRVAEACKSPTMHLDS